MLISLIITTYNRPDALLLVLKSVEIQSVSPLEVIIADDGSDQKTMELITNYSVQSSLTIIHSFQNDKGFRASKSRNKAIARSNGDYIILIDGDMILHPEFIRDHAINSELGCFVQGGRVLLSHSKTSKMIENQKINLSFMDFGLKNRKNSIHSSLLSRYLSIKKNYLKGIKTCNLAFFKKDCIAINGFNNDFEGWGREDSEFSLRLMNSGIERKTLKFNAIQFHLWHHESSKNSLKINDEIMQKTINKNLSWCENGINNYL